MTAVTVVKIHEFSYPLVPRVVNFMIIFNQNNQLLLRPYRIHLLSVSTYEKNGFSLLILKHTSILFTAARFLKPINKTEECTSHAFCTRDTAGHRETPAVASLEAYRPFESFPMGIFQNNETKGGRR